jgi:hypothetical protein
LEYWNRKLGRFMSVAAIMARQPVAVIIDFELGRQFVIIPSLFQFGGLVFKMRFNH